MLIAQLSDLHVRSDGQRAYGQVDTNAALRAAVATLLALATPPDCVLLTGDVCDCGLPDEYAVLRQALQALPMPVYPIPGNHDRRETFVEGLSPLCPWLPREGFVSYVVDHLPVRLIALDTVVPGRSDGEVCAAREAWLAGQLAQADVTRPTLLFMHHPPFAVGVDGMDSLACRVSGSFAPLLARHPNIERVLCGHYHRSILLRYAGTLGFVAPSTAHQVALDLRRGTENRMVMEPPALALHHWRPDIGLVTHLLPIGDFGPVRDFILDPSYPGGEPSA